MATRVKYIKDDSFDELNPIYNLYIKKPFSKYKCNGFCFSEKTAKMCVKQIK